MLSSIETKSWHNLGDATWTDVVLWGFEAYWLGPQLGRSLWVIVRVQRAYLAIFNEFEPLCSHWVQKTEETFWCLTVLLTKSLVGCGY